MKKSLLLILASSMMFAATVEVKRSKAIVEINGERQFLLKGDKISLKKDDTICIVKGKGKLVINNEIRISMKSRDKCYKNFNDSSDESLAAKAESYLDGSEESVSGMSRGFKFKKPE